MRHTNLFTRALESIAAVTRPRVDAEQQYLKILESYAVTWDLEKAARDTWQNFFDANNGTLDDVNVIVRPEPRGRHSIIIRHPAEYDHRYLLHLGGTSKTDSTQAAGGFGEGAKILALSLLRDHKFSQVRFGSRNWILDFALRDLPRGEYVSSSRGLYADIAPAEYTPGNFIHFIAPNEKSAGVFLDAQDLFFRSDHPDFQKPTLDIKGVGGFRFLPSSDGKPQYGNFYYAGQRRHVDEQKWNTVKALNVWTRGNNLLAKDRDRGIITSSELLNVISHIIKNATKSQLVNVILGTKEAWTTVKMGETLYSTLSEAANHLGYTHHVNMTFADEYLADEYFFPENIKTSLIAGGYSICPPFFEKLGMRSVSDAYKQMGNHFIVQPSEQEQARLAVLYSSATLLGKKQVPVRLFDMKDEKSIIKGQHTNEFVWMSREVMGEPYNKALATYLHEIDHEHGGDYSATFSYALTDTIGDVIERTLCDPGQFVRLRDQWTTTVK
ncbi:TPA: hypothetical protein HA251_01515 [Candidatus Woesearchaeota archaeon]|nr:hypothetical protein [Candidatus Woesearchaeota archaeon]